MDWAQRIQDLLDDGMTQGDIAAHIRVSQPTISALLNGNQKDMLWKKGQALSRLHNRRLRAKRLSSPGR